MTSCALDEQAGRCGDAARNRQEAAAKFLQSMRGEG